MWRESDAHVLLQDAAAYLAEFYVTAGRPGVDVDDLDPFEDAIDYAMGRCDMFALRIAVREWVRAGVGLFKAKRDRGAA